MMKAKAGRAQKYLLEFERGNAYSPALKGALSHMRELVSQDQSISEISHRLDDIEIEVMALEYTELRILGALAAGQNVEFELNAENEGTELQQLVTEAFTEIVAMEGMALDQGTPESGDNFQPVGAKHANGVMQDYFNTRKVSIYAGSNEIQRNIMSKMDGSVEASAFN